MIPESPATYDVLIIGCGNIAGGFDASRSSSLPPLTHAGAYAKHGKFSLRACLDPDAEKLQRFAQRWKVEKAVQAFSGLAADAGSFDVISICSPTDVHHEHIEQALGLKPRLIFCEKPLTADTTSAAKLVAACKAQGVTLVVNYSRRWDPSIDALVMDLNTGRWGQVRSVVAYYNKGILNNGGHMLDLLFRLFGTLDVMAATSATHDFWPDDPTVAALLMAGNVPVYLSPSDARDYAYFELEIVCELGVVRMLSGGMSWQFREAVQSPQFNGYKALDGGHVVGGSYIQTMSLAIENIHAHLRDGTAMRSLGEEALRVQELCMRIKRMAQCAESMKSR